MDGGFPSTSARNEQDECRKHLLCQDDIYCRVFRETVKLQLDPITKSIISNPLAVNNCLEKNLHVWRIKDSVFDYDFDYDYHNGNEDHIEVICLRCAKSVYAIFEEKKIDVSGHEYLADIGNFINNFETYNTNSGLVGPIDYNSIMDPTESGDSNEDRVEDSQKGGTSSDNLLNDSKDECNPENTSTFVGEENQGCEGSGKQEPMTNSNKECASDKHTEMVSGTESKSDYGLIINPVVSNSENNSVIDSEQEKNSDDETLRNSNEESSSDNNSEMGPVKKYVPGHDPILPVERSNSENNSGEDSLVVPSGDDESIEHSNEESSSKTSEMGSVKGGEPENYDIIHLAEDNAENNSVIDSEEENNYHDESIGNSNKGYGSDNNSEMGSEKQEKQDYDHEHSVVGSYSENNSVADSQEVNSDDEPLENSDEESDSDRNSEMGCVKGDTSEIHHIIHRAEANSENNSVVDSDEDNDSDNEIMGNSNEESGADNNSELGSGKDQDLEHSFVGSNSENNSVEDSQEVNSDEEPIENSDEERGSDRNSEMGSGEEVKLDHDHIIHQVEGTNSENNSVANSQRGSSNSDDEPMVYTNEECGSNMNSEEGSGQGDQNFGQKHPLVGSNSENNSTADSQEVNSDDESMENSHEQSDSDNNCKMCSGKENQNHDHRNPVGPNSESNSVTDPQEVNSDESMKNSDEESGLEKNSEVGPGKCINEDHDYFKHQVEGTNSGNNSVTVAQEGWNSDEPMEDEEYGSDHYGGGSGKRDSEGGNKSDELMRNTNEETGSDKNSEVGSGKKDSGGNKSNDEPVKNANKDCGSDKISEVGLGKGDNPDESHKQQIETSNPQNNLVTDSEGINNSEDEPMKNSNEECDTDENPSMDSVKDDLMIQPMGGRNRNSYDEPTKNSKEEDSKKLGIPQDGDSKEKLNSDDDLEGNPRKKRKLDNSDGEQVENRKKVASCGDHSDSSSGLVVECDDKSVKDSPEDLNNLGDVPTQAREAFEAADNSAEHEEERAIDLTVGRRIRDNVPIIDLTGDTTDDSSSGDSLGVSFSIRSLMNDLLASRATLPERPVIRPEVVTPTPVRIIVEELLTGTRDMGTQTDISYL